MRSVNRPEDRYRTAGELRNELAIHLEKLMSGRVSYGMPAPASRRCRCRLSTAVFAVVGLQPMTSSVRTAVRDSRSRCRNELIVAAYRKTDGEARRCWNRNSTRRSFFRKTATCSDAPIRIQTSSRKSIFRDSIRKKVSRRHARIWLEGETFLVEDLGSVNGTVINDSASRATPASRAR